MAAAGRLSRPRLFEPLRSSAFRHLWAAAAVSVTGDGIFLIAIAWQNFEASGGISGMALIGVALAVPQLVFFPLGGVLADRGDRRLIMMVSDIVRCACVIGLAAVVWSGAPAEPVMYGLVATYGAATGMFGPAFDATVPALVPDAQLTQANALDQLMRPIALRLLGPAVGGLTIHVGGAGAAFSLNVALFATSAMCLRALPRLARGGAATSAVKDFREGVTFVRSQPWLWATLAAGALGLLLFLGPSEVLVPYLVKEVLNESALALGLVFACGGVGAVVAASLIGQVGLPARLLPFTYIAWTLATVAVAGYGYANHVLHFALVCALVNAGEAAGLVAWATAKQRLVPRRMLGRVSSVDWFISTALVPLSYALTAPVAEVLGARVTLIWAGVLGGVVTLAFLLVPSVWRVDTRYSNHARAAPGEFVHRRPPASAPL